MKFIDLSNKKFFRLTVVKHMKKIKNGDSLWQCICDCGNGSYVHGGNLKSGHTQSCGCLKKERISKANKIHGETKSSTFNVWVKMRQRCNNPKNKDYKYYGGRGIKVCKRWEKNFTNFITDMGKHQKGLSIDRIDNNGNYEPSNCRWITISENIAKRNREYAHN